MHGLVRCKHEPRVFTRACGADVSFSDVTIKIPDRGYDQGYEWRHAPEAWAEIWEKSVEFWRSGRTVGIRGSPKQDTGLVAGAHVVWGRWKSQHRKMVSLSLCRKTFKLKGNKKFRTWTKKSEVFFVFRDSYVLYIYIYIYIYMCVMNILCTFHIFVSWCTSYTNIYGRHTSFSLVTCWGHQLST